MESISKQFLPYRTMKIKSKENSLILSTLTVFIIKTGGALFTLLSYILLSRLLGAANVGAYYLSLSVISIASTLSLLGMNNPIVKYSARSYEKKDTRTLTDLYTFTVSVSFLCSFLLFIIVYIAAPIISNHLFHNPELINNIRLMSLAIIPMNLMMIHSSMLKGIQKSNNATIVESLAMPSTMTLLLLLFSSHTTLLHASIFYIVATFVSLWAGYTFWKKHILKATGASLSATFNRKQFLNTSMPLFSVAVMTMIMGLSDTIMLGYWHNSETVGVYGSALKVASISTMFLVVANTTLAPKFAILFEKGAHNELAILVRKSTQIMSLISLFFLITYLLIPEFLLSLFGEEFIRGKTTLIILSIGQFFVLGTGAVANLLMMTGHEKFHRKTTTFSAVLNIVLNFVLIPSYGSEGAAFATSLSLALKNIIAMQFVRVKLNIRFFL